MTRQHAALGAVLASFLAACGGGGKTTPPPPTTFTISGTITSGVGQLADLDTKDPHMQGDNDTPQTAQLLPSSAIVGGWASETADLFDNYRASLGEGQLVTLLPADPAADLDLCVATVANTTVGDCSVNGPGVADQVVIAAGWGEVYIQVQTLVGGGETNYLLVLGQSANAAPGAVQGGRPMVPGEILVRFKDDAIAAEAATGGANDLAAKASTLGLVPLGGALRGRSALLGLPEAPADRARTLALLGAKADRPLDHLYPDPEAEARRATLSAIAALRARPDVASADPNYIFHPLAVPNDTYYPLQWHYPLIDLPQAWDITTGTPATGNVVVAVVDTGVVLAHPDLAGKLVAGYDFISNPAISVDGDGIDANPDDPGDGGAAGQSSFHGTHVSGTVGAATNNGLGVAGVSWGAKIMPVRVLGKGGGTSFDIIQGIRWAAGLDAGVTAPAKKADVINLSLGGGGFSQTEQNEYTNVRNAGTIIIAASGNENSGTPGYPASYDGVVSVSAVDTQGARAPYSNFGPKVDIAAPGGDTGSDKNGDGYADGVLSTLVEQDVARTPSYVFYQGTSMATPHMAGVVALMKAVCPTLTPAQLDTLISSGNITTDLGTPGRDDIFGYGLVNALKAVQQAQTTCGTAPTEAGFSVDPGSIDFGNATTMINLTATKIGTGTLANITQVDDAAWLTLAGPGGTGLGQYTATVNRTGLANGTYSAKITFTSAVVPTPKTVTVTVAMRVGAAAPTAGDAGFLYLLLTDSTFTPKGQVQGRGTNGSYAFSFTEVPNGTYYLVAGTDSDDDGLICDAGEACGAWPTLGVPTAVEVNGANVTGLNFVAGFDAGLGLQSTGLRIPEGGLRRLDRDVKSPVGAR